MNGSNPCAGNRRALTESLGYDAHACAIGVAASFSHNREIRRVERYHEGYREPRNQEISWANSTGTPYVTTNFAPLESEVTGHDLEVSGHIPEEQRAAFFGSAINLVGEMDEARLMRYRR